MALARAGYRLATVILRGNVEYAQRLAKEYVQAFEGW
jgi:hypothetical protein